jgi:hypothetical protein
MKKFLNYFTCITMVAVAFIACDSDDDDKAGSSFSNNRITAKVENGSSYNSEIDKAYVELSWEEGDDWGDEIFSAVYTNGGFELDLPAALEDKFLSLLSNGAPSSITISDKTVKTTAFESIYASKSGKDVGSFELMSVDPSSFSFETEEDILKIIDILSKGIYSVEFVYADKPVTIHGSYVDKNGDILGDFEGEVKTTYNASLAKGWNILVAKTTAKIDLTKGTVTGTVDITSSQPSGLKWYYIEDSYAYAESSAKSLKSASSKSIPSILKNRGAFKLFH